MQWIFSIPLVIAVVFSTAFALLRSAGVPVQMADPVTAGVITAVAGMIGAAMPLRHTGDAAGSLNAGLLGTVLHLLCCIVLTIAAIAAHVVDGHGRFLFWILGGYWISILTLVWLAKRVVTAKAFKAQH